MLFGEITKNLQCKSISRQSLPALVSNLSSEPLRGRERKIELWWTQLILACIKTEVGVNVPSLPTCAVWTFGSSSLPPSLPPTPHISMLNALIRWSKSPMFAAWKSSGWSIMDRAILRAAQMFPDITWWDCWRLWLFLWRLKAVRKLLAASLWRQKYTHFGRCDRKKQSV